MKLSKIILSIFLTLFYFSSFSQDTYKKRYYIEESITYKNQTSKKEIIKKTLKLKVNDIKERIVEVDGKEIKKYDTIPKDVKFSTLNINEKSTECSKIFNPKKGRLKANIKFEKDKIYVNSWLIPDGNGSYLNRDKIYYYELENRQSLKIGFRQWTLNALTVPLKVRFGKKKTEFTTGANLGAMFGYTWGKTNFVYRDKIGNKQYDSKVTTGLFIGADELEFKYLEGTEDKTVKSAFISIGSGVLYSYQKFTLGATFGFDFGLGENSSEWKFQGRPWLGASLGYSLFTF